MFLQATGIGTGKQKEHNEQLIFTRGTVNLKDYGSKIVISSNGFFEIGDKYYTSFFL